jgi:CubicO group peptidase (beta-lactamase class C family)
MRQLLTVLSLGLLIPATTFAQKHHNDDNLFSNLDTAFARVLKDWHAAGFAVAVVNKDTVIYARGFGYKDLGAQGYRSLPHTLFAIGSCTKGLYGLPHRHAPTRRQAGHRQTRSRLPARTEVP